MSAGFLNLCGYLLAATLTLLVVSLGIKLVHVMWRRRRR